MKKAFFRALQIRANKPNPSFKIICIKSAFFYEGFFLDMFVVGASSV